ncbi:CRISPR-associated endonuclease Cas4/Cas1 [Gordonia amarae]|uniref:CRISPR-associated endonuclease Cas1 n=2 Tax=Gordonia amarae TaxID=36821 RepID=G7GNE0_9ACTN|nr:CRISPR-associated endonuclease Cas4/Cas1 [Gordonia amarae]MCS3880281.1 CRISPR-associated protein Cas1 [Gordonia amarae]QHN18630.1 CRISPR-associated endonuclease Cas4/Cas1 [Gordonia amarae]QHN23105.1 CRISPR-associated endonuclease Cas4/Cas1 [Gordonia amarae]QHN32006.1 CRISPR-associated endonuclease Cas4/Cas1 [Gordonia amarae]QHN40753.1 CRISPR-associated endonuclease Cas4/Cas1 [Gordonia amarae]
MTADIELLPARMLNEYVYCPRLFYFEWVDKRWAPSHDTEHGSFVHRAVDKRAGSLPEPEDVGNGVKVTALQIESHALGLVAVLDRVDDGGDGTLIPVDTKKGKPSESGAPWSADVVQLYAQAALLRDAGYEVDRGVLYYAEINRRITIPIGDVEVAAAIELADEAREVAARPTPPLPLVASNRCPRCSLVGLCMPDETNALLRRDDEPPRRIVPRDPDARPVYVTTPGAAVGIKGGRLRVVQKGAAPVEVRLIDVAQLCVYGSVQVSTQVLTELWSRGVPVLWFSYNGWLRGWAQGEMSKYVQLRIAQAQVSEQRSLAIATAIVAGKIKNSRTLLRRNARTDVSPQLSALAGMAESARSAASAAELLGIEGAAARVYFGEFSGMVSDSNAELAEEFDTNGRRRRPAPDPINALLGYVYALLVKDVVAVCLAVGLDPYIGVYHKPRYGRPALALDLMEEFRPLLADSAILSMLNNGEVTSGDFERRSRGCWLTLQGRRKVIRAYERRLDVQVTHPVFRYKISYRRVLDVQARILAGVLIGELRQYTPMVTR